MLHTMHQSTFWTNTCTCIPTNDLCSWWVLTPNTCKGSRGMPTKVPIRNPADSRAQREHVWLDTTQTHDQSMGRASPGKQSLTEIIKWQNKKSDVSYSESRPGRENPWMISSWLARCDILTCADLVIELKRKSTKTEKSRLARCSLFIILPFKAMYIKKKIKWFDEMYVISRKVRIWTFWNFFMVRLSMSLPTLRTSQNFRNAS